MNEEEGQRPLPDIPFGAIRGCLLAMAITVATVGVIIVAVGLIERFGP